MTRVPPTTRPATPHAHRLAELAEQNADNPEAAIRAEALVEGIAEEIIGFGDAGPMIVRTVQERAEERHRKAPSCALVQRLDEAVDLAHRVAGGPSVVLLSPGGTSYDAYRDFEERGEHFRSLVHAAVAESRRPV